MNLPPVAPDPSMATHPRAEIISRSATVALWRVINALREGWFLEKRLRNVARMIAEEARRQGLDADEMLAALKEEWPRLLACRRVPDEADLHMLADRLVAFCTLELGAMRGAGAPNPSTAS